MQEIKTLLEKGGDIKKQLDLFITLQEVERKIFQEQLEIHTKNTEEEIQREREEVANFHEKSKE